MIIKSYNYRNYLLIVKGGKQVKSPMSTTTETLLFFLIEKSLISLKSTDLAYVKRGPGKG